MLELVVEVIQYEFCDGASGIGIVTLDHVLEFGDVVLSYGVEVYHFPVTEFGELAFDVVDIGDAAAHAGGEVAAGVTQDDDSSSCHVFTAVVTYSFDAGFHPGVPDAETFAGFAADKRFTRSGAVEGYVADDAVFFGDEGGIQ